jgi:hypothetical protein
MPPLLSTASASASASASATRDSLLDDYEESPMEAQLRILTPK